MCQEKSAKKEDANQPKLCIPVASSPEKFPPPTNPQFTLKSCQPGYLPRPVVMLLAISGAKIPYETSNHQLSNPFAIFTTLVAYHELWSFSSSTRVMFNLFLHQGLSTHLVKVGASRPNLCN